MKRFTSFITSLPFSGFGFRKRNTNLSVKNKKTFMIETIEEVTNRLSLTTVDMIGSAGKLNELKDEFNAISKEKREVVERLRDVQAKFKFIIRTTEHLRLKQREIVKETDDSVKLKNDLESRALKLKDEQLLDVELADLKNKSSALQQDMAPSIEKLKALESEKNFLIEEKDNINQELNSVTGAIRGLQKEIPELGAKKSDMEQLLQSIAEVRKKYDNAKEEQDKLNNKQEELQQQAEKGRKEIDDLKSRRQELQSRFMEYQREKEKLDVKTDELEGRKKRMDDLNEALKAPTAEREDMEQKLRDFEEKMEIAGTETGDLHKELEDIRQKKNALQQERTNLEEKCKPVVDILNKVEGMENNSNKEKSKYEELTKDIDTRKRSIRSMELELHYYKEAIEDIGQRYL